MQYANFTMAATEYKLMSNSLMQYICQTGNGIILSYLIVARNGTGKNSLTS